jgi:hypothetical protein
LKPFGFRFWESGKMRRLSRDSRVSFRLVEAKPVTSDFADGESDRVLGAAARAVAHELGRQAADEYFDALISKQRASR